jgi:hypothetical protein
MKLFASLAPQDRKLLIYCLGSVVVLAVLIAVFSRNQNRDDNPLPSTFLNGKHGASAAYELLASSGYKIERWEQPLSDLAAQTDSQTVVLLADPFMRSPEDFKSVAEIVHRGGRVVATGLTGGLLLPDGAVQPSGQFGSAPCQLTPLGLDPLASSGQVWMTPDASWRIIHPSYRVQYQCASAPAVVQYQSGGGQIVWWASSTPLENGSIRRDANLELLLNSLGPRDGHRFYWDESLHGDVRTKWFYVKGPAWTISLIVLGLLALVIVLSFSRRSGPVRDLPLPSRATPIEFLEALGSLYAKAGAAATAVELAYERFRRQMGQLCGRNGLQLSPTELAAVLRLRFPQASPNLEADLAACALASHNDTLAPKRALMLVQALDSHAQLFRAFIRADKDPKQKDTVPD